MLIVSSLVGGGDGLGKKCELYYLVVQLQQSERSSHQNNMLDLVIRPLDISHPHIIVKDQHLIINNKVNFCVCKYNNYFDTVMDNDVMTAVLLVSLR